MNVRPKSIEHWSPNFTPCDPGRIISCVIIHATATASKDSALNWLCDPESKVSAHYLIDLMGAIYHLVHESNIAWHAGESEFNGLNGVNQFSVGIELVNTNVGTMPFASMQLYSCADLVSAICKDYDITASCVVGHADIAPGRKDDPYKFPWDQFRQLLTDRGVKE